MIDNDKTTVVTRMTRLSSLRTLKHFIWLLDCLQNSKFYVHFEYFVINYLHVTSSVMVAGLLWILWCALLSAVTCSTVYIQPELQ